MKRLLRRLCAVVCICAMLVTSAAALSIEDALALLEQSYVNELPPDAYRAESLDALFSAVGDPYTYYMTSEEYQAFLDGVEDEESVTGIGAAISYGENGILITSVLPGSGAEDVGLGSGDLIIAINGESCIPAGEADRAKIIGEAGTSVRVTVRHEDDSVRDYTIKRRVVPIHNTLVSAKDGVGTIDCDSFGTQTGEYFIEGINKYDKDVHLWVVDLRSNSGGVSSAAVDALGAFAGSGPLLCFRERSGRLSYNFCFDDYITDSPVIVLTNAYTASAAEIFAGGIRASRAGISVGGRTFGKGVAQIVYDQDNSPLFDGDALKLTAYRFYLADGNTTDRIGVIPTLLVPDSAADGVAALLSGKEPSSPDGYLRLTLSGWDFYVDLSRAQNEANQSAFAALISSLAPDAELALGSSGVWFPMTAASARTLYGNSSLDRWFTDVSDCGYTDAINTLGTYGLVLGNGDGAFRPLDAMTRAEVCALLAQALNVTAGGSFFTDIPAGKWYTGSVNAMAALGLVNGVGDGRFDPSGTMTQEQFFTVMGRLAAFLNCNVDAYCDNLDADALAEDTELVPFAAWSRSCVKTLSSCLIDSDGESVSMLFDGSLSPKAPILRGQAAATMYNLLNGLGILSY